MGNSFSSKEEKELTAIKNEWLVWFSHSFVVIHSQALQTEDKAKYNQEHFSTALSVENLEKNRYVSVLARMTTRFAPSLLTSQLTKRVSG